MKKLLVALGLGIIILNMIMRSAFPQEAAWMPESFNVPIIAFEFLQTNEEVLKFFGEGVMRDSMISGMNLGHKIDFFYALVYASFLGLWGLFCFKQSSNKLFYVVIIFAVLAGIFDLLENNQLVAITNNLENADFTHNLSLLFTFTWLKWGSIAIGLFGLSPFMIKQGWFGKIFVLISVFTLILAVIAFFNRSAVTSYFTLGIVLQFGLLIVMSFFKGSSLR